MFMDGVLCVCVCCGCCSAGVAVALFVFSVPTPLAVPELQEHPPVPVQAVCGHHDGLQVLVDGLVQPGAARTRCPHPMQPGQAAGKKEFMTVVQALGCAQGLELVGLGFWFRGWFRVWGVWTTVQNSLSQCLDPRCMTMCCFGRKATPTRPTATTYLVTVSVKS